MNNILITGGAGYVGTAILKQFKDLNYNITIYDNLLYGGSSLLPFIGNKKISFINGDIRDKEKLKKFVSKNDIIIHLAAIVGFPACRKDPVLAEQVNYEGTLNLIKSISSKDQLLLSASTGSNYGDLFNEICTEESPLKPLSVYGVTKTKAEKIMHETGNAINYRFATAFGSSNRLRLDLLINDFVFKALKTKNLIIYEKHFQRTFIHVDDIARSFLFAIENYKKMKGNIYNVGSEDMNFTKQQIAEKIKKKIDFYLHYAEIGEDPDKRNYFVSYKKINKLGFSTTITIEEGIDELIKVIDLIDIKSPFTNV